jgi:hypothetical protein
MIQRVLKTRSVFKTRCTPLFLQAGEARNSEKYPDGTAIPSGSYGGESRSKFIIEQ